MDIMITKLELIVGGVKITCEINASKTNLNLETDLGDREIYERRINSQLKKYWAFIGAYNATGGSGSLLPYYEDCALVSF